MLEIIKNLVEICGPSGYEDIVRAYIHSQVEPYVDEIKVDALGSLIVRKGKKTDNGKKIMIAGHMDEIGVIATHIDDNGFVRFTGIGGVAPDSCLAGRVQFVNGTIGVINKEMHSFTELFVPKYKLTLDKLYIDVGATTKDDCPVKVGDVGAFHRPLEVLGNRLVSKAMDDRIAVAVMILALREIKQTPHELYFVFTVQEETGLIGAKTSAFGINPDLGMAIDVTPVVDTPEGIVNGVSLGKGPAIKVKDSSLVVDPRLVKWMTDTAAKSAIPVQYEVLVGGGTDAGAINLTRSGIPATCLSIPTRYVHTPSEMVDLDDVKNAVKLTVELLINPVML